MPKQMKSYNQIQRELAKEMEDDREILRCSTELATLIARSGGIVSNTQSDSYYHRRVSVFMTFEDERIVRPEIQEWISYAVFTAFRRSNLTVTSAICYSPDGDAIRLVLKNEDGQ